MIDEDVHPVEDESRLADEVLEEHPDSLEYILEDVPDRLGVLDDDVERIVYLPSVTRATKARGAEYWGLLRKRMAGDGGSTYINADFR